MDLSRVVTGRLSEAIELHRVTGTRHPNGDWQDGPEAIETIRAVFTPTGPGALQLLPEGERYLPSIEIHCASPVAVRDYFNRNGKRWRVAYANDWNEHGFYHAIAVLHQGSAKPGATGFVVT